MHSWKSFKRSWRSKSDDHIECWRIAVPDDESSRYKLGDPFDKTVNIGPVVSRAAQQSINAQIEDAVAKGAVNATPVNSSFVNPPIEGNYVVPTILTNTNHSMAVMKEETFGPVIPVMKVGSDEEAVRWMNDSDYGLTASIWTNNLEDGKTLLKQLEAGTVFINRCDYPNPVSCSSQQPTTLS